MPILFMHQADGLSKNKGNFQSEADLCYIRLDIAVSYMAMVMILQTVNTVYQDPGVGSENVEKGRRKKSI